MRNEAYCSMQNLSTHLLYAFALRKRLHGIENTDEERLVRTYKGQVSDVQCAKHVQSITRHSQLPVITLTDWRPL